MPNGSLTTEYQGSLQSLFQEAEKAAKIFLQCIKNNKEYDAMLKGEAYNSFDSNLVLARTISSELAEKYSLLSLKDYNYDIDRFKEAQCEYLSRFVFHHQLNNAYIEPPFRVDFGNHIKFGRNFYCNFNTVFLDCASIVFGDDVLCGPNVTFSTAGHPTDPKARLEGEFALPIVVGNNVWFGSNCVILPGVTIGDGSVVGAGTIVTKSVEPYSLVLGVPGKVVKKLENYSEKEEFKKFL